MQYITKLDRKKLGEYEKRLITENVILTDERLYEHILLFHEEEYKQLRPYFSNIYVFYNNLGFKDCYKFSPTDYTREQFDMLWESKERIDLEYENENA